MGLRFPSPFSFLSFLLALLLLVTIVLLLLFASFSMADRHHPPPNIYRDTIRVGNSLRWEVGSSIFLSLQKALSSDGRLWKGPEVTMENTEPRDRRRFKFAFWSRSWWWLGRCSPGPQLPVLPTMCAPHLLLELPAPVPVLGLSS